MDERTRYEAVSSRDARFDGAFFFAVVTTGIYCRPSCPAVTPKRANVRFYPTAAAAQAGGFRACRRCRPDAVPGSAEWNARADVVGRAVRLIGDGVVDREGVPGLAGRLGYSARQVQRQLTAELGAGPVALARAQRSHTARVLLQTTGLPVTEIAFAAGFASVRQFNDTIRQIYARTPSALRAEAGTGLGGGRREGLRSGIPLRLAHRGPYATAALFDLLAAEAVARVEEVAGPPGRRVYRRTLRLPYGCGIVAVDEAAPGGPWLEARVQLTDLRDLTTAVQRVRRLFDLDADPYAVDEALAADPRLAPLVAARPGLRSPGAADPEEAAVRTLVGRADAEELVERYGKTLDVPCGGLTHLFPEPGVLAGSAEDPALRALAAALDDGVLRLDAGADRDEAERVLLTLPGIGRRTAALIRMRALGDPDVDPCGTPGAELWRPWRSYAVRHLEADAEAEAAPRPS
ncbi:DNA-3-methyladenine glycosylase 2 family protein [Streptomyces sp. NPDC059698]|uniref:DNA-3-methyladenine glycosylase 2 family protein n=1 Tax=unclassified Streptomyces TaxID=2593676 RepID=UPI00093907E0|nr:DNA-3-methyladenine glycosylase 2 family protein [Streptomyces sp. CB02366]OKJ37873.1 AraC family transcriptional regulator [Streptomyces sp. CB02366]TVP33368.1 AraC family transcriptional regulator [Streptomyces griseus subsp. griseus]WSS59526.1 helix-turn-helix domain-containing protein [Streptomyces sp. NBC_01178]